MSEAYDCINWCPECGEPRDVCMGYGQCPLGVEAKKHEQDDSAQKLRQAAEASAGE